MSAAQPIRPSSPPSFVPDPGIARWMFTVSALIAFIVVFGGLVRLTGSGLSMTDWHVVTGVFPPLGQEAWQEEFDQYRQSPEYQQINQGMTLAQFRFIYYMEYTHRLLGRLVGLVLAVPLIIRLVRRRLPPGSTPIFIGLGLLMALQGYIGWYMVQSGLVNDPHVSHYRLTIHLLAALALLAGCLWQALSHWRPAETVEIPAKIRHTALALWAVLWLQIAAGGLLAGLKAGHISDTFPLMFGRLIPDALGALRPLLSNILDNPVTIHFQHRWFAFAVVAMALVLRLQLGRWAPLLLRRGCDIFLALVLAQVLLGIGLVWWHVPLVAASLHQFLGLALFVNALFIAHRAVRR
ncbi:MAG: heme A synthase [Candidatus Latescibacteria bacterium]|nr:heme A synthase [Candidatus Latescibacterota bacterium]